MNVRNIFSPVDDIVSDAGGKSLTKQSCKDECDVNMILAKFQKTGALTHVNERQKEYGEHTGIDFKEAIDLVMEAQELFDDLPSKVRTHFDNDPAQFLDYVNDPDNVKDVESGFKSIVSPPEPAVEVVQEAPEAPSEAPQE